MRRYLRFLRESFRDHPRASVAGMAVGFVIGFALITTLAGCQQFEAAVEPYLASPPPADVAIAELPPEPVTEIPDDAPEGGLASWCAPTPTHCQSWGGDARLGAVPSFSFGDKPYLVNVCRQDDTSRCTTVRVVSFCGCGNKAIDLSPAAFVEIARIGDESRRATLDRGVVPVIISRFSLPPTSTEP